MAALTRARVSAFTWRRPWTTLVTVFNDTPASSATSFNRAGRPGASPSPAATPLPSPRSPGRCRRSEAPRFGPAEGVIVLPSITSDTAGRHLDRADEPGQHRLLTLEVLTLETPDALPPTRKSPREEDGIRRLARADHRSTVRHRGLHRRRFGHRVRGRPAGHQRPAGDPLHDRAARGSRGSGVDQSRPEDVRIEEPGITVKLDVIPSENV